MPLSPNGSQHPTAPVLDSMQPMEPSPAQRAPEPAGRATPTDGANKEPRLDFLFRSKAAGRPTPQPENFDAFWPADGRGSRNPPAASEPAPRADQLEQRADHAPPPPAQSPAQDHVPDRRRDALPQEEPQAPSILKSGVVDGMAYTLYSDGSIEAKLPHGTVRFGSIAELRAHIESNSYSTRQARS